MKTLIEVDVPDHGIVFAGKLKLNVSFLGAPGSCHEMELPFRIIEPQQPPQAQKAEDEAIADHLYDDIHDLLFGYHMNSWQDADGDPFRLADHLSHGNDISTGKAEIDLICDEIYNSVLLPSFGKSQSEQGDKQ